MSGPDRSQGITVEALERAVSAGRTEVVDLVLDGSPTALEVLWDLALESGAALPDGGIGMVFQVGVQELEGVQAEVAPGMVEAHVSLWCTRMQADRLRALKRHEVKITSRPVGMDEYPPTSVPLVLVGPPTSVRLIEALRRLPYWSSSLSWDGPLVTLAAVRGQASRLPDGRTLVHPDDLRAHLEERLTHEGFIQGHPWSDRSLPRTGLIQRDKS